MTLSACFCLKCVSVMTATEAPLPFQSAARCSTAPGFDSAAAFRTYNVGVVDTVCCGGAAVDARRTKSSSPTAVTADIRGDGADIPGDYRTSIDHRPPSLLCSVSDVDITNS